MDDSAEEKLTNRVRLLEDIVCTLVLMLKDRILPVSGDCVLPAIDAHRILKALERSIIQNGTPEC